MVAHTEEKRYNKLVRKNLTHRSGVMIKEFSVKNFLSFKDEVTFQMEALVDSVSEYPDHVVKMNNNEILKVSSFYGPNASGKSNLLRAINFLRDLIVKGPDVKRSSLFEQKNHETLLELQQFVLTKEQDDVTTFKLFIVTEKYEIGYELSLHKSKTNVVTINYERMSYLKPKQNTFEVLYERKEDKLFLNEETKEALGKEPNISNQITLIGFINLLYVKKDAVNKGVLDIFSTFYSEVSKIIYIPSIRDLKFSKHFISSVYEDDVSKENALARLRDLGIDIADIIIDGDDKNKEVRTLRKIDGNDKFLNLAAESDGTISALTLIPLLTLIVNFSGILLVDELDAHLHPKLTHQIIKIFQDKRNKKAQIIFTSHDFVNLDNDLFRRDEVWFVAKNKEHSSEIFALTDIVNHKGEKVRKDAKYSKQYLEGRYGADPFINKGINWYGEDS